MDVISVVSVLGGAALYIASAFLTFRLLELSKDKPWAAVYVIVKGAALGAVCAFVPPLLLLINVARGHTGSEALITALILGSTLILPLVYAIVVTHAFRSAAQTRGTGTPTR